jgi:hypothetical protein
VVLVVIEVEVAEGVAVGGVDGDVVVVADDGQGWPARWRPTEMA